MEKTLIILKPDCLDQDHAGEVIARHGIQPQRGPLRDALTLFDENAVLLHAPDALWQALQRRDWHASCCSIREPNGGLVLSDDGPTMVRRLDNGVLHGRHLLLARPRGAPFLV